MVPLPSTPGQFIFALLVTLLTGGGFVSIMDTIRNRGKPRAEITATVSAAAAQVVEMLQNTANEAQKDSEEARNAAKEASREAQEARREAAEARREVQAMRLDMEILAYRFRRLVGAILDDDVSRDDLKAIARSSGLGGNNG